MAKRVVVPPGQTVLCVPVVNTLIADQVTNSKTPMFVMEQAWLGSAGTWVFFLDGVSIGSFGQDSTIHGHITTPLKDGLHYLQAKSVGMSPQLISVATTFRVDTMPPAAPTNVTAELLGAPGVVSVRGNGVPGLRIMVFDAATGGLTGGLVDPDGTFWFNTQPLKSGSTYVITAVQYDKSQNPSAPAPNPPLQVVIP